MNPVHFSSRTDEWATPRAMFAALDAEFGFDLDPCASAENATCARYFTKADDGLRHPWRGVVFMNPPYGDEIARWVRKAYDEAQDGSVVVALVPARTDTAWWHDYVTRSAEIRFLRGRLRFGNSPNSAPFPSAVVVFRPGEHSPRLTAMARVNCDGERFAQTVLPLEVPA